MTSTHCSPRSVAMLLFLSAALAPLIAQPGPDSPIGKTKIAGFYAEAPLTPGSTTEAASRTYGADLLNPDLNALDAFYQPFSDKLTGTAQRIQDYYTQRNQAFFKPQDPSTMRAQASAQANQNPIVASMGGVDAIAQMSPAEREAAARKAAAAYQADPFGANGIQSDGMTAVYQKIISDPAYAARFQNMSEKERETELRNAMANDKPQVKTPAQMQEHQQKVAQQNTQANKVRAAMAFQQVIAEFQAKINETQQQYQQQRDALLTASGNHEAIEAEHSKKYKLIPVVELGEYGHDHDPVQVQKLRRETAVQHRDFAARVLKKDLPLLHELKAEYTRIAGEYSAYVAAHRQEINGNLADQMNGTETETLLAQFEMTLLGLAQDLSEKAKTCTREAAQWERNWWNETR